MRILFLTKQQYMGKDLLRDRFGRFYEFPKTLAAQGHQVCGVCLKYWDDKESSPVREQWIDGVQWRSFRLGWNWPIGFLQHYRRLNDCAMEFEPDAIVGASDAAHVILAMSLSAKLGTPFMLDLYDNFESYRATQLPGIKRGLRRGIEKAAAISTVSHNLAEKVLQEYQAPGIVRAISNAVCPEIFHPGDKMTARRRFKLPESALLIGTAGALSSSRGVDMLLAVFEKLARRKRDLYLALAGPVDGSLRLWENDRVRYLGELPHADVGHLFNALDVGVICNRRNPFAEYCFPQKFYEMVACRIPVVVADVGAMGAVLTGYEECLYDPDQAESLTKALDRQLEIGRLADLAVPSWNDCGQEFHELLQHALSPAKGQSRSPGGELPRCGTLS